MKVIYLISPDYLEPAYKLAKPYNFKLQGYGSVQVAIKRLITSNISDILGFVYFAERLPENPEDLIQFMKLCDSLKVRKKFLFALQQSEGLAQVLSQIKLKYLQVFKVNPDIDIVTDVVINKQIFGSILADNFSPYYLKEENNKELDLSQYRLQYQPLFNDSVFRIMGPVTFYDSFDNTLIHDNTYNELVKNQKQLAELRKLYIQKMFNIPLDFSKVLQNLDELNNERYCIYRALIYLIGGADVA